MVPVIIYQDNLSYMAIMARGGPTSERSRHINIRYFLLCERIKLGEVTLVYRATDLMYANVLTKPLQGKQFATERDGITKLGGTFRCCNVVDVTSYRGVLE